MRRAAITVDQVTKTYGPTTALDRVSLEVQPGEAHALVGRNGAGKSTLVAVLTGLVAPDAGTVRIGGAPDGADPDGAVVACVYQKSTLMPDLTAAENIATGAYPRTRLGLVDWRAIAANAERVLGEWGFAHVGQTAVGDLEPLERKIVEIGRALSRGPQILLLDEPTAGLDADAAAHLFDKIAQARARGVTLIYVSHHLKEVFEVCDTVTILRDGRSVFTGSLAGRTVDDLVHGMVGDQPADAGQQRRTGAEVTAAAAAERQPVLTVRGVTTDRLTDVSLSLQPGERLGVTGLEGAGHVQLAEVLAGLRTPAAGSVELAGRPLPLGDVHGCIRAGIGFVPEDRQASGYVPALSVEENATLSIIDQLATRLAFVDAGRRRAIYRNLADRWSIKAATPDQPAEELSGGNQQKVVLARALASDPTVLVLVNPTAGVDVAAKASIYASIGDAGDSATFIATTDEADLRICDRVLVMRDGAIVTQLPTDWDERQLAAAAQGVSA